MMCYKDKTFCTFHSKCVDANKCGRALTDEIKHDAQWHNMPVSVFRDQPECFAEIEAAVIVEETMNNQTEVKNGENQ